MSSNTADSSSSLLQALGHPLSDRRLQVLRALGECGSISQAARAVGVSYKAAWQAIDTLSNLAGVPVVQKSVGGAGGGGARLTEAGQELLRAAEALAQAKGAVMQQLQSRLPVQRLGIQTSMRNQWPCMVQQLAMSGPLAQVHLQGLHADVTVQARITAESAQLLGLHTGMQLLAMCKATAVEVTAATASLAQGNSWQGKIARITPVRWAMKWRCSCHPACNGWGLLLHTQAGAWAAGCRCMCLKRLWCWRWKGECWADDGALGAVPMEQRKTGMESLSAPEQQRDLLLLRQYRA